MGDYPPLPSDWHNHEGLVAIFRAALQGICANPHFFGPVMQQSPQAAVDFARDVLRAALAGEIATGTDGAGGVG